MIRMFTTIALLALCITPADLDAAARADRAQFPVETHGYYYYASTAHLLGESRAKCEAALAFTVASTSRQQIVEKCVPPKVADGLYRLDLQELKWDWRQWHKVVEHYPYGPPGKLSLVIRADWLVVQLGDTTESDGYYRLLYGTEKLSRDDFLRAWGVGTDKQFHFGIITKSEHPLGPAVAGQRHVENRPTATRGSAWLTRDSAKITSDSDALEHLAGDFKHDAEEHIVTIPKVSLTTGQRGALFAYLLSDGKGNRQEEAPPSIVTDHLGFRGQKAIRNFGSCVGCHATGYLDPGVSELRTYIRGGVDIYATPKELQEQIELFHLSDASKQIRRDNEDWVAGVAMVNGLDGESNAEAFAGTFATYDADVNLEAAASELYTTPETLRLALAYYNNSHKLGARLAGLAHNLPMSRTAWEEPENYYTASVALNLWEASTK